MEIDHKPTPEHTRKFKFAYKKIVEQGKPSINEREDCVYRGLNGLKCFAGHLIPDDKYDRKNMEYALFEYLIFGDLYFPLGTVGQFCHDFAAKKYNVSIAEKYLAKLHIDKPESDDFIERFKHLCGGVAKFYGFELED